jgi:chromosome segregation ATPase
MKRSQVLYGVTMQSDGISQLLSVKLEDAPIAKK